MLQWVITQCRKLTQEELSMITEFKMGPNNTFECPEYIEIKILDRKPIQLSIESVMAGDTKLEDMYFVVLTDIYRGTRMYRVDAYNDCRVWTDKDIQDYKDEQEKLRIERMKSYPNDIFAGLTL